MSWFWPDGYPVLVDTDAAGIPDVLVWGGRLRVVIEVANRWRVEDGWWRADAGGHIRRDYYKLVTYDGMLCIVYQDLVTGDWHLQRLYL